MAVFGDLNEVKVIGNMTQDVELKSTNNDNKVTNISIATNRSYKQGEEWKEEVTFHNVVVWGNDAKYLSEKASKGTRIFVSGRLQTRSWEQDGVKKYKTEIVANQVILLDRYKKSESNSTESASVDPDLF